MLRADDLQPADLFRVVWRQRFAAIAMALVGAALAYAWALFIPDRYTATTLVLVEEFDLPQQYASSASTVDLRSRLATLSEQILSRTRIERLMDEFQLYAAPGDSTPREARLASVRRRIRVQPLDTEGFRISFTHEDPKTAARIANALAELFITESTEAVERQVSSTSSQIQDQLTNVRLQLDAKAAEIRDFRAANRGALPEQLGSNHDTIQAAQLRVRQLDTELGTAHAETARLEALTGERTVAPALSARDQARQILTSTADAELDARLESQPAAVRLEARRLQRDALLLRYTARHPDVRALETEIRRLESTATGSATGAESFVPVDPSLTTALTVARQQVSRLQSERTELRDQILTLQNYIDRTPDVQAQLTELDRDHSGLLTSYQDLQGRTLEAELARNLQSYGGPFASFRVVDPAVVPQTPASPQRIFFFLAGAFAGVGLVFGGAVLREMLVEPIDNATELERHAQLTVLAAIPAIDTPESRRSRRLRWLASATAVGSVLTVVFILRLIMRP